MLFLFFEILFLMLLAALAGGALVYWWFRNRYEDVTESFSNYRRRAGEIEHQVTRKDLERGIASLSEKISGLDRDPDFSPLDDRLLGLESSFAGFEVPETDLGPLFSRLSAIEDKLDEPDDSVASLQSSVRNLEDGVARVVAAVSMLHNADLSGVEAEIEHVSDKLDAIPQPDLDPIQARLDSVEQAIGRISIPRIDLTPVTEGFRKLEQSIADIPPAEKPDLTPVNNQVGMLEKRFAELNDRLHSARSSDLETIRAGFSSLSSSMAAIPAPDLEPLQVRLQGLERSVAAIDPIETRLSAIQDAIAGQRETDLTPVLNSVRSIDSRLDLAALENRLTAIEYGLAAVHHMLRSKPDTTYSNGGRQMYEISSPGDFSRSRQTVSTAAASRVAERPARETDPINPARRQGDKANLLIEPAFGAGDDLTRISGVGPMLSGMLNDIGVYYFWQVAEWTDEEIEWVDSQLLHFSGRIKRDDWVGQAADLAAQPTTAVRPASFRRSTPQTGDNA